MKLNFRKFMESAAEEEGILDALRSGDQAQASFNAYVDKLEEEGREIPPELQIWKEQKPNLNRIHVRWMIRRDMKEVLMIEKIGMKQPWDEAKIMSHVSSRENISMVAVADLPRQTELFWDVVVGYVIYKLNPAIMDQAPNPADTSLDIIRIAVHPLVRKSGVGKKIIEQIKVKNRSHRRGMITANHPEGVSGFFQKQGFLPQGKERSVFTQTDFLPGEPDDY